MRDADKPACVPVAAALAGLGFRLLATGGTADTLRAAGLQVERVAKVGESASPTILDLVKRGRCDLVINTPQGSGARADGYVIREAALAARVPCITTISGAAAAVHAIANARTETALSLQERIDVERTATNAIGEGFAVQQFHDDEVFRLELLDPVNRADVWMIQSRRRPRLSLKALEQTLVAGQGRCQELQGDVAAQVGVFSFIHDSHPTLA